MVFVVEQMWSIILFANHFRTYTVTITLHESGTRKAISWTVTVYNKKISCQSNLLAQLEPVQDKYNIGVFVMEQKFLYNIYS
jgi:hypothetical protein